MAHIINVPFNRKVALQEAHHALAKGDLVAIPTETVYGLGADATNDHAVAKIYEAKGRPSFNPLISHVSGLKMAQLYGEFGETALKLADAFWPGPLTLVVPTKMGTAISSSVTAGLDTIALRHPIGIMAELSAALERPIAAPSANPSGSLSPTLAEHVAKGLGDKVAVILDNGPCPVGLESTIVHVDDVGCVLLREGGIPRREIDVLLHDDLQDAVSEKIVAPGMLLSHYAPQKPLRLNEKSARPGEALLAFGPGETANNLSPSGDLSEAAHNLFAMLAALDATDATAIVVQPIPGDGLGAAINDRLKRAAAPRMKGGQNHG